MEGIAKRKKVLEVRDLTISFQTSSGLLKAIRGVHFTLYKGETLAIVGESGSGKSVTVKAVMGMMASNEIVEKGEILYTYEDEGAERTENLLTFHKKKMIHEICGKKIAMVFQDPMTALNPVMSIGQQLTEGMRKHLKMDKRQAEEKGIELLRNVGIPAPELCMKNYPHQLSGGMRQRVVIAIALACNPDILICDEPTTALDVTIQAKILELIHRIQLERHISIIYITHDLGVVAKVADHVAIMYAGRIIERGTAEELFFHPRHPYTWGLLLSMPGLDTDEEELQAIPGNPPNLTKAVKGDAFAPRNAYALNIDYEEEPPIFHLSDTHEVSSWLEHPDAPHVDMPEALRKRIDRMTAETEVV